MHSSDQITLAVLPFENLFKRRMSTFFVARSVLISSLNFQSSGSSRWSVLHTIHGKEFTTREAIEWLMKINPHPAVQIARIESHHPRIGAHLTNAIKTGSFSSYQPERNVNWVTYSLVQLLCLFQSLNSPIGWLCSDLSIFSSS